MKPSKRASLFSSNAFRIAAAVAVLLTAFVLAPNPASAAKAPTPQWSLQVQNIEPGDIALPAEFRMAIYEELISAIAKKKQFEKVYRDGDRTAEGVPNLLVLKTTVRKFSQGSETKRAVTTVTGWTKIQVHSQLFTRDGKLLVEYLADGTVRFMSSNLHVTRILARHVANEMNKLVIPDVVPATTGTGKTAGE